MKMAKRVMDRTGRGMNGRIIVSQELATLDVAVVMPVEDRDRDYPTRDGS